MNQPRISFAWRDARRHKTGISNRILRKFTVMQRGKMTGESNYDA